MNELHRPATTSVPMAMPITMPAAAWRVRRKQSSRIDAGSGRMKSTKISQSGSESG